MSLKLSALISIAQEAPSRENYELNANYHYSGTSCLVMACGSGPPGCGEPLCQWPSIWPTGMSGPEWKKKHFDVFSSLWLRNFQFHPRCAP